MYRRRDAQVWMRGGGEGRECSTDSRRPAVRWRGSDGERKEGRVDKKMW